MTDKCHGDLSCHSVDDRPVSSWYVFPALQSSHFSGPTLAFVWPTRHTVHCASAVSVHICDGSYPLPHGVQSSHRSWPVGGARKRVRELSGRRDKTVVDAARARSHVLPGRERHQTMDCTRCPTWLAGVRLALLARLALVGAADRFEAPRKALRALCVGSERTPLRRLVTFAACCAVIASILAWRGGRRWRCDAQPRFRGKVASGCLSATSLG